MSPCRTCSSGHFSLLPAIDDTRGRRRQGKQFPQSTARAAVRAPLQDLAKQDQRRNHRRRLEIDFRFVRVGEMLRGSCRETQMTTTL